MPVSTAGEARHALVVGAGLAGAAVTAALIHRGWRVSLLDAADGPAQGASSLPVGMLSPHTTRAPTPLSRLSALGVAAMRVELERLLPQGAGWHACEVDNLGHDPGRHPAALVRPGALVAAWLAEAQATGRLHCHWNAAVHRVAPAANGGWQALHEEGHGLAQAPVAVVASAFGSRALLADQSGLALPQGLPLHPVKGQLSLAALQPAEAPLAERPQRDKGVFVPSYQDSGLPPNWPAHLWAAGSTYHRGDSSTHTTPADHERNAHTLAGFHPGAADRLRQRAQHNELLAWAQVRCASLDRLPLVGALPHAVECAQWLSQPQHRGRRAHLVDLPRWPGLFVLCALGSRGLSLAHWCAQQLAALLDGETPESPIDSADLMRAVDPARFLLKAARRTKNPPTASAPAA